MAAASPSAGSAATAALSRSIYDAMLSQNTAGLKLKLDIVDTLFLDEYGDPSVWYYTDAKSRTVRKKTGVDWGTAVELLRSSAEAQGAGAAAGEPTVVERSRAVALLLQDEDLTALAQRLSESNVQENPPTETSPFCLQPYVPPANAARYVAVYIRSDHGTACEAFPCTYGSRYLDVTVEQVGAPASVPPLGPVADAVLLEIRHLMLSTVTFMRKAHSLELDGLAWEFVQDKEGKLLFHTTVGTHVAGKQASWSCDYDAESKLVKSLVDKLCAKQPALKIFQRSSVLPSMNGPMPSPQQRVRYRQQAQREIDQLLTPRPPSSPNKPTTPPISKPRTPKSAGGGRLRTPGSASRRPGSKAEAAFGGTVGSEAYQTAMMDTQQDWTLESPRGSTPGRLHTLASLRHYQVETLKDALQEQFASATQAELERLQEANRRQQATRECEAMHESYAELQRYHDGEMEKASATIADLSQQLEDQTEKRKTAEEQLAKMTEERDFARAGLAAERTAHDEKTLGHGGRIHELEQELMGLESTLGANVESLTEENARLRQQMQEEREEIGALNQQLVKFSTYIEQLEGTRDKQLQLITDLRAERGDLLRMTPSDRSSYVPKDKTKVIRLNINDLLCREINPVAEMDLVQKALTGRKLVLQELYKYYSWSPETDGASRHQKLTMSAENFVKLATDAKLLSNQGSFTPAWAENIFVASCLKRYSKRRADGKAIPVAERYLKQNEFVEAVVRVSYAKHPDLPNLADKVERCMEEKFLPFSKHKGSQITNWFQQVCEKEALAFEN